MKQPARNTLAKNVATCTEIDVSIERARLSRDQAKLQEQTEQLAREREQLAKAINPADSDDDTPMLRRWKKFITNQDS